MEFVGRWPRLRSIRAVLGEGFCIENGGNFFFEQPWGTDQKKFLLVGAGIRCRWAQKWPTTAFSTIPRSIHQSTLYLATRYHSPASTRFAPLLALACKGLTLWLPFQRFSFFVTAWAQKNPGRFSRVGWSSCVNRDFGWLFWPPGFLPDSFSVSV